MSIFELTFWPLYLLAVWFLQDKRSMRLQERFWDWQVRLTKDMETR